MRIERGDSFNIHTTGSVRYFVKKVDGKPQYQGADTMDQAEPKNARWYNTRREALENSGTGKRARERWEDHKRQF